MSVDDRMGAAREQLRARPYGAKAGEFVRFALDSNDDAVAGIVRTVTSEGSAGCDEFRRGLDADIADTLRLFAMRRTLQGRRSSSTGALFDAMDGWALLPTINDIAWESWLKASLFIARSLGNDLDMIGRRFEEVGDELVVARFDVAHQAMERVLELDQCRMTEVKTSYGVGFVEMLVFREAPRGGLSRPPKLGDNRIAYEPSTNLAQLAVTVADGFDATGEVVTGPIGQDQLAATFFSLTAAGSYLPCEGCLSFVAERDHDGPSFTVFVAELGEESDIEELASSAADTNEQSVVYDDRRLILLSPQPSFDEADDDLDDGDTNDGRPSDSLKKFEDIALSAINEPATR
jgi:hypothetical protein